MLNDMPRLPDVLRIEPAGLCNFGCVHCPIGTEGGKRPALEPTDFRRILERLAEIDYVPRVAVLYHAGEPLLNPHLEDYVAAMKGLGVRKVQLVTNASLLTPERSRGLISAGLDEIHVSFDGESPAENDAIRRRASFDADSANVIEFCGIRKISGREDLRVLVSNVRIPSRDQLSRLQAEGRCDLPDIPAFLRSRFSDCGRIDFQSLPAMVWPGLTRTEGFDVVSLPQKDPRYCSQLFEIITVLSNGDLVPCCYDLKGETVFGNIFAQRLDEIWNGTLYSGFRAGFRAGRYTDFCRRCALINPRYLCRPTDDSSGETPGR